MQKNLLKGLAGIILSAFLLFSHIACVEAAQYTRTLTENTRITPAGVIVATWSDIPKFKKGTVVTLNEYGEVLEGTLAEDASLPYETGTSQDAVKTGYTPIPFYVYSYETKVPANRVLPFKGGTKVTFNAKGEVINGTVKSSRESITLNQTNQIFISNGEISFHKNGMVATCTLASNSYLRPVGWLQILTENYADNAACSGLVEFKADKAIILNEKGEVLKGTLNKNAKLLSAGGLKAYEAGTTVEFDDQGTVVKAENVTSAMK